MTDIDPELLAAINGILDTKDEGDGPKDSKAEKTTAARTAGSGKDSPNTVFGRVGDAKDEKREDGAHKENSVPIEVPENAEELLVKCEALVNSPEW